ncbi:septum site-determining protein MinD [Desulfurobacterium thermolithotrophum]|uniref:septum site-determining protein MinD n=1 Tax=Desulfurobacterium thermolithotrophum TaxID=64160 RepID=UPI0013D59624|nr:septum site-determining protein MinD [Desulfurobacterium thermolithotrophum]
MADKVICVTSGKGGVGKSTITGNLATALAAKGYKVVAIDADIGLRNLDLILGLENRIVYDIVHVAEGVCPVEKALVKDKRTKNLHLLPAAQTKDKNAISPEDLINIVESLREKFDFIFIDSPAGIEEGFKTAVTPADTILVVANPEMASIRDADRVTGLCETMGKPEPKLIVNRLDPKKVAKGDMLDAEDVVQILGLELIGIVPEDKNMVSYINRGEPAVLFEESIAGKALRNVAERLLGKEVPFLNLEYNEGFFEKLKKLFGGD